MMFKRSKITPIFFNTGAEKWIVNVIIKKRMTFCHSLNLKGSKITRGIRYKNVVKIRIIIYSAIV